jgi:catechol 2,3-dioxygenase-like lactoylglutathione lyase family enzyme
MRAAYRGMMAAGALALAVSAPARADWQTRLPQFPRYDTGEVVESLTSASGAFTVSFSRAGRNAVPTTDADGDGKPDQAQLVARVLDEAYAYYRDRMGLRPVVATSPFDAFLVDFSGRGDGQFVRENCLPQSPRTCAGLLLIENDFTGYAYGSPETAVRTVASHELFHAVQAARGADDHATFSEGSATWATEEFDGTLTDFERAIRGYLMTPDQALAVAPVGPVSSFSYGSALFFRYLSERYGDAAVASLLAGSAPPRPASATPPWLSATVEMLERDQHTTFAAAFADFTLWNALTGSRAPAAGAPGYKNAASYPLVTTQMRALPFYENPPVRVFPASARVYSVRPEGPTPVRARLSVVDGTGTLEVALVGRRGGVWGVQARAAREVEVTVGASQPGGTGMVDAGSDVLVVVSNGEVAGQSTRINLCVGGDEAALAPCPQMSVPTPPAPNAGKADEGGCTYAGPLMGLLLAGLLGRRAARRVRRA